MNILFIATRIAGNDGVSLEINHWKDILQSMGHSVSFMAGELDRPGIVIPELSLRWPESVRIHDEIVFGGKKYNDVENEIFVQASRVEKNIRNHFNSHLLPDLLIIPNMLSLPMNFSAAVGVSLVIKDLGIRTIARHHDFWWERERYGNSSMMNFWEKWFPPKYPNLTHVVINSNAQRELKVRTGLESTTISDSFDFKSNLNKVDAFSSSWKKDFGIESDEVVFLQATRIVPRKRIEISMDFVKKYGGKSVLVIAGVSGDEGVEYEDKLRDYAKKLGIKALFIGSRISSQRVDTKDKIYTLWDCYVNSDVVLYPPELEGFGNQFVEAIYFKKPIVVTPYPVYKADIAPLGFEVITLSEKAIDKAVSEVRKLLADPKIIDRISEKNFSIGEKHFSYEAIAKKIEPILSLGSGLNR